MQEYAQTLNLKDNPEVIRQYKEYHAQAWPEVIAALKQVGVIDMKIYLLGRRLFMYMTTRNGFDPAVDFPAYLQLHPRCQEWEDLMGTFQEKVPEAQPHEKWALMEKVFQLPE
jgi:L-rhamnose mutarotase